MDPASSPDNARSPRGPGRLWSGHGTPDQAHDVDATTDRDSGSSSPGPTAGGSPPSDDSDHPPASGDGDDASRRREDRPNPWDLEGGTVGGFGLSGRFLHGGHTDSPGRPGLNGRRPELNGWTADTGSTQPDFRGADPETTAAGAAHQAERSNENGRDEMNGQAGIPGYPTTGETEPAEPGRRRDLGDVTDSPSRRPATGWASVPTPTDAPTSGSGAPGPDFGVSGAYPLVAPVSPGYQPPPGAGGTYGQAPAYQQDPISSVPAPRAPHPGGFAPAPDPQPGQAVPVFRPTFPTGPVAADGPSPAVGVTPVGDSGPVTGPDGPGSGVEPVPADAEGSEMSFDDERGSSSQPGSGTGPGTAPVSPAGSHPGPDSDAGPGSGNGATGQANTADLATAGRATSAGPHRSASLEDAEPVRRGRRAAPDSEDAPDETGLRPGDVAPGQITFWDDDATRHFRDAWHEVKAEFVDDPVTALTRAHDLLTDAVNELTEALLAERDELDPLRGTAAPDTENMRMAMRGYREFLDRILAL